MSTTDTITLQAPAPRVAAGAPPAIGFGRRSSTLLPGAGATGVGERSLGVGPGTPEEVRDGEGHRGTSATGGGDGDTQALPMQV